jgi:hypothetical protein
MTKRRVKEQKPLIAFKGFDKDFKCRGHQYEVGKHYKHEGPVQRCASGLHSCEYPLDVLGYYPPADSRFALVEVSGAIDREKGGDSKIASAELTIKAELKLPDLIAESIKFILAHAKNKKRKSGERTTVTNTGYQSAASNTGDYSAASNTGYQSAASNTGDCSAASNTGDCSAASIEGDPDVNKNAVAIATGYQSKAKATAGSAIVCVYRDDSFNLVHIRAGIAGKDVKPDTWYTLNSKGEFEEVA